MRRQLRLVRCNLTDGMKKQNGRERCTRCVPEGYANLRCESRARQSVQGAELGDDDLDVLCAPPGVYGRDVATSWLGSTSAASAPASRYARARRCRGHAARAEGQGQRGRLRSHHRDPAREGARPRPRRPVPAGDPELYLVHRRADERRHAEGAHAGIRELPRWPGGQAALRRGGDRSTVSDPHPMVDAKGSGRSRRSPLGLPDCAGLSQDSILLL